VSATADPASDDGAAGADQPPGSRRPSRRADIARLVAAHDRPGPRYTSYPTAVEFHEGVGEAEARSRLARANERASEPLSLYLHLPFCEHRCLFCGCNVIITPHKQRTLPYLDLLVREAELVAALLPDRRALSQLHLGGGTPTYNQPADLARVVRRVLELFPAAPNAELAVEVDPRVTTPAHLDALGALGFNRISLGVQDFSPAVQQAIERHQSADQTRAVIEHARARGFRGVNLDLIYGLPFQTPQSFEQSVRTALSLRPDRSAVYSYAYVPWKGAHMKDIDPATLPPAELKLELGAIARELFLDAGYEPIGMDHYAAPHDELALAKREGRLRRNFQGYTVIPATDVIGLGISSIGDIAGAYLQNTKKLSEYEQWIPQGRLPIERGLVRSAEDELRREVIHELMCNFRLDVRAIEARHGIRFAEHFARDLELLGDEERQGLVVIGPERIEVTPTGELFVRNLAMCFDTYWRDKHEGSDKPKFSRTV
jgi:oxygen-independent coproporphyrinogen-3 oxidase